MEQSPRRRSVCIGRIRWRKFQCPSFARFSSSILPHWSGVIGLSSFCLYPPTSSFSSFLFLLSKIEKRTAGNWRSLSSGFATFRCSSSSPDNFFFFFFYFTNSTSPFFEIGFSFEVDQHHLLCLCHLLRINFLFPFLHFISGRSLLYLLWMISS